MKRFLIPLVLLLVGLGGGIGAGLALAPPSEASTAEDDAGSPSEHGEAEQAEGEAAKEGEHQEALSDSEAALAEDAHAEEEEPAEGEAEGHEYVRLNNQFVVPLLEEGEVASLVLLSIAVEVPAGHEEEARSVEPKLRDTFLQILFDHANAGGFEGLFTAASAMRELRNSLLNAAEHEVGELVTDVLILDLARQSQ